MDCEHCKTPLAGPKYGSGRFCGPGCARAFSTHSKRGEINARVRQTLKGRVNPHRIERNLKDCASCGSPFETRVDQDRRYCGKCFRRDPVYRDRLSQARIHSIEQGAVISKKALRCLFSFKGENIRCDSKLEYACLSWFCATQEVRSIRRCSHVLPYIGIDGTTHRYLPDFEVVTTKGVHIVECKVKVHYANLDEKWGWYNASAELKKGLLAEFCYREGLTPFWFGLEDDHRRWYRSVRLPSV